MELANALPRFSKDGTGLEETDIEAFDKNARLLSLDSAHLDTGARELVAALAEATRRGQSAANVAPDGEAWRESRDALRVKVGDKTLQLAAQTFWTVVGNPREEVTGAVTTPPIPIVMEKRSPAPAPVAARPQMPDKPARPASPAPPVVVDRPTPVVSAYAAASAAGSQTLTPSPTKVLVDPTPKPAQVAAVASTAAPLLASMLSPYFDEDAKAVGALTRQRVTPVSIGLLPTNPRSRRSRSPGE